MTRAILLLLLVSCRSDATPPPARAPVDDLACRSDSDCVVSCVREKDCCGPLCGCDEVRHRATASEITERNFKYCQDFDTDQCPVADCMPETYATVPACEQGACVGLRVPWEGR